MFACQKDMQINRTTRKELLTPQIYETIIRDLPIGFSLIDRNGFILEFNSEAERLTGLSKDDVMGRSHFEIIHDSKDPTSCPLLRCVSEEPTPSVDSETVLKKKDGSIITLQVIAFPLFDTSRKLIGGAELFRDISALKRLERERKNLLSMFAHDMKNPVVAAIGFLTRLLSGKVGSLAEKQQSYIEMVMQAVTRVHRLISDFLYFSRFEGREYSPTRTPYDIEEAINRQVAMFKVAAEEKRIDVSFDYSQEDLPVIDADAGMIDRVLANFIDNAIKYTESGGAVTIRLKRAADEILVEVQDTGIGIPEQDMGCVFESFCRINRDQEGSGLGLSIARAIVEAHRGKIGAESSPGKGSRFWFNLPSRS